jgi:hypothetical protein
MQVHILGAVGTLGEKVKGKRSFRGGLRSQSAFANLGDVKTREVEKANRPSKLAEFLVTLLIFGALLFMVVRAILLIMMSDGRPFSMPDPDPRGRL